MSNGAVVAEHDNGYKLLFSHPQMVADLLRDFIREDWVRDLDFSTLEKVPGSYVTRKLSRRESDVVWRLRLGNDRFLYVYLLIEFQSTVDPFMALRMMVYLGLLYQDLDPAPGAHPFRASCRRSCRWFSIMAMRPGEPPRRSPS